VDSARSWAFYARQDASQADFDFVIGRWRAMAEAGDALAQTMLGFSFNNAFGVPLDESAAFQWIKRSAIQGNPRGQHALGTLYGNGQGTPKNLKLALECFELAAAQGDSESQEDIGNAYQFGLGVRKNNALAATRYRKAAEAGNASAAYNLAYMYDAGRGMRRDYTEALKWYGVAAMHGSVLALNNLAVMYLLGEGVARDPAVAYEFASLARAKMRLVYNPADASTILRAAGRAESKLDAAQRRSALFALGERCRDGSGVPRDYVEAYRWMMVSAADEPDDATRKTRNAALEELASRMHPEAVARAKRLTP
jgi:TPR repeat protein